MKLAESLGTMASGLVSPGAGSSPPSRSPPSSQEGSPSRRNQAFCCVVQVEQLTPRRLACARVIFCGSVCLADKYLSFGDSDEEVAAWGHWLIHELEAVAGGPSQ